MTAAPPITFITVCKGRLAHLKRSLPIAAAQAPCVVVDFACPEGTGDWVEANYPVVSVVRTGAPSTFNLAAGRNAGAAAAHGGWFCFFDADVILSAQFLEAFAPLLQPGQFYRPWPLSADTWGTVVCARADFERIGGYDEAIEGWGTEDDDLYRRLQVGGVRPARFPAHLLSAIEHDDAMRTRYHAFKDPELDRRLNFAYLRLKEDLRLLLGTDPELALRKAISSEVRRVLSGSLLAGAEARIALDLPDSTMLPGWNARRTLVYTIPACPLAPMAARSSLVTRTPPSERRQPMPFIVGSGRCGSTLLRLMLDSHPALAIPDETHFIPRLARLASNGANLHQLVESLRPDARWATSGVSRETLLTRARARGGAPLGALLRAFYECYAERFGKPRYGDKTPPYVYEIPLIREQFPEARFVHLIRDGRDVALSMRENAWWGPDSFAQTAAWWSSTILTARKFGSAASDYFEVRYEDLVNEPEVTLRRICEFIELEWDATMLRYYERADERLEELTGFLSESGEYISTERVRGLHTLTREPPNASRIGAWRTRLTPGEIRQFELLAGPLLNELGYDSML